MCCEGLLIKAYNEQVYLLKDEAWNLRHTFEVPNDVKCTKEYVNIPISFDVSRIEFPWCKQRTRISYVYDLLNKLFIQMRNEASEEAILSNFIGTTSEESQITITIPFDDSLLFPGNVRHGRSKSLPGIVQFSID